jgi:hypothetical protein
VAKYELVVVAGMDKVSQELKLHKWRLVGGIGHTPRHIEQNTARGGCEEKQINSQEALKTKILEHTGKVTPRKKP